MSVRQTLRHELKQEFKKFNNIDNIQHDIHPEVNIRYNTLNIFVGQRGSGKTFNAFNEIATISRIQHKFHLFIYVSNNPNDMTYIKFKSFIEIPHIIIPYASAEEFINEIFEYKQAYDEIKQKKLENKITDECKEEIFNILRIKNFNAPWTSGLPFGLGTDSKSPKGPRSRTIGSPGSFAPSSLHTLIIYDDAMEVFKKPKSKQFRWLLENRHTKSTYILCLQDWKGISPELKANIDSVWLFGGYPRNRYTYIFNQISCPIDRDDLYNIYRELSKRDVMIFNHKTDGDEIKVMNEQGKMFELRIH